MMRTNFEKQAKLQKILIILSHLIGKLGSSIFTFGIGLMILRKTGSASNFGFTQVIGPIVGLLLLPFTGSIIDKINHKKIIVVVQISSILAVLLFLATNNIQVLPELILIYILLIILTITDLFLDTTYSSSLISMVDEKDVQKMMSIKQMISTAVMIVTPIIAGLLYSYLSFEQFVIMEISSEIVTLFIVLRINFYLFKGKEGVVETESNKRIGDFQGIFFMFSEGLSYVKQSKHLMFSLIYSMFINIVFTCYMVGFPYVLIKYFRFGNTQYGIVQVALSVGMLVAGVILSKRKEFDNPLYLAWKLIFLILFILGLIGGLVFFDGTQWFNFVGAMMINFILGVLLGVINIPMQVMLTKSVPPKMQGRIFNLMSTSSQVFMPMGTILFGILFDSGIRSDIIFISAALVGIVISLLIPMLLRVRWQELGRDR